MLEEKEKKLVYIAIGIIVSLLIFILLIIWIPTFSNKNDLYGIDSIAKYEDGTYVEKKKEEYKSVVIQAINKDNFEETYNKLDKEYLEKTNLNKDDLKKKLIESNILSVPMTSSVIYCSNVRNDGQTFIFTYVYKIADIERKVHIIEKNYDEYSISFVQDSYPVINSATSEIIDNVTGLKFNIKTSAVYEGNVVYDITIINNTTEEFIFSTNEPDDSNLIYSFNGSNKLANLSSIVIGSNLSEIVSKPGSSNKITLSYGIALEEQKDINYIKFNDITRNDGSTISIQLELN